MSGHVGLVLNFYYVGDIDQMNRIASMLMMTKVCRILESRFHAV